MMPGMGDAAEEDAGSGEGGAGGNTNNNKLILLNILKDICLFLAITLSGFTRNLNNLLKTMAIGKITSISRGQ